MNIFDSGVTASKVAAARADKVKAEETYRQTTDSVQLDVRNNYLSLREAEKRIATSQTAVSQAEEDYRISILRYQAGVGTNTDVMDAQVALTQAKNNYIQALYDYNTSGAQLDKAMGVPVIKEDVAATGTAKAAKTK
ncbi:MAG: TolC family protein, partial [Acidaminococcaceae bacterium]|nr:TolC family protein [Acidaminococcaceae bacterium]